MTAPDIQAGIVDKLASRTPESSICPSDVARELGGADDWRELMPAVREAAPHLAESGIVIATQKNDVVDAVAARGPIRFRRGPRWQEEPR
ncbi:DUF3253 domain-containing protein [Corynebacterium sp. UBA2622]|uniref:DUF3253 domain-containing protein n=1 Tax=Corynebacterium sp. UBA2622 TaxID=1946393 RepID=UPI0025BEC5EA|nr:DUF3253 domain-containing protein [Corynebacterium sp. UBA2622]